MLGVKNFGLGEVQKTSVVSDVHRVFLRIPVNTEIKLSDSRLRITNRFLHVPNQKQYFSTFSGTINNKHVPKCKKTFSDSNLMTSIKNSE